MKNTLLNPFAKNNNDKYVSIEHASKNQEYFCSLCNQPFSYCERGKGEYSRRDHFKHKVKTTCSGPSESYIHSYAKHEIHRILNHYVEEQREFPITWTCHDCGSTFSGNLLKGAKHVEMEKQFKDKSDDKFFKQPDVSLVDEKGNLIVAIEVIFTHDVEDNTLHFFEHNNAVLVRICVQSAEECNDMEQMLKTPDSVNLCFNRECHFCQTQTIHRTIFGLWNKDKTAYIAFVPGVYNPFGEEKTAYLPFLEQDKQIALSLAKKYWPEHQSSLQKDENFYFVAPVRKQKIIHTIHHFYHSSQRGPLIENYERRMEHGSYRTRYPKRGKSSYNGKRKK